MLAPLTRSRAGLPLVADGRRGRINKWGIAWIDSDTCFSTTLGDEIGERLKPLARGVRQLS